MDHIQEIDDTAAEIRLLLAGIHDETCATLAIARKMQGELAELRAKVDRLEAEFGPLARKYGRLAAATDALPGVKWGRRHVPD